MTLTVKLAEQEQKRLEVIVASLNANNQSDAVRALINEKFEALQASQTLVERRGGHPKYLLNGTSDLSSRSNRKSAVADALASKVAKRAK